MKPRKQTPSRRPELLTEATVTIPDGTSITAWLREVEKAAIKAVAAKLPPAPVDDAGRYPDQWLRMVDARPDEVVVCVSRWSGPEDSFQSHFRVPYESAEDGTITTAEPVEVEVEFRMVYTDVAPDEPAAVSEAAKLREELLRAVLPGRAADRHALAARAEKMLLERAEAAEKAGIGDLLADLRTASVSEALAGLRGKKAGAVELAESVFRDVSGRHPLAGRLGAELAASRGA